MKIAIMVAGVSIFCSTAPSWASVLVQQGNNPESNEQNVLLNGLSGPGTLVTGSTNQTHTLVNFTTSNNQIAANPNGQSFITGVDGGAGANGGTFSNVTISLADGGTFTDLIFALDLPGTGRASACGACVSYSVTGSAAGSGTLPGTVGPGTTFFTFRAHSGESMSSVRLSGVGSQLLEDLRQVRLSGLGEGGVTGSGSEVPEPASILLLAGGIVGMLVIAGRRRADPRCSR